MMLFLSEQNNNPKLMTTVINTPSVSNGDDSGFGFVVGVLFVIVLIGLFVLFALPYLKNKQPTDTMNINVQLPATTPTTPK